jgi:predicted RNA methylase
MWIQSAPPSITWQRIGDRFDAQLGGTSIAEGQQQLSDEGTARRRFAAAAEARQEVERWSAGAQALALITSLHERGWMRHLAVSRSLEALSEFSGLPPARLQDVVQVLEAHRVVERDGSVVRLREPFRELASDDAWVGLTDVLDHAEVAGRLAGEGARGWATMPLSEKDALAVARAAGGRTTAIARSLLTELMVDLPEWAAALRSGRWLDVGCGVASTTLTLATMYPEMRALAVEIVPAVAATAERRSKALGVDGRVEVRTMDARDLTEQSEFNGAFWAQPFFPEPTRAATLAVIHRALRPGALLIVQELESEPQDAQLPEPEPQDSERRSQALRRLFYRGWHVPFGRTAEQLTTEAEAAGFVLERTATTSSGQFVLLRRPDDVGPAGSTDKSARR